MMECDNIGAVSMALGFGVLAAIETLALAWFTHKSQLAEPPREAKDAGE